MQRRRFLKGLALALPMTAQAIPSRSSIKLTTLPVAGLQYGTCSVYHFDVDTPLRLIREPDNPHDRHAVALYHHVDKVGYIPHTHSRIIASMIDNGISIKVKVRYLSPWEEPWDRVWVSVWM